MNDVVEVSALSDYRLLLTFADGVEGEFDVRPIMAKGGVFEPMWNPDYFAEVRVDDDLGTVAWPNGADLSPEMLYEVVCDNVFAAWEYRSTRTRKSFPIPFGDENNETLVDSGESPKLIFCDHPDYASAA